MPNSTIGTEPAVTPEQYYAIIRQQIEHEDNLIGQRLSWLVASQSFLFTAYAITVSNAGPNHAPALIDMMRLLTWLIPVTAILTSGLIYAAIVAGTIAIARLRGLYHDYIDRAAVQGLPPVQGYRGTQVLGQAAPMLLPMVFLLGWVVLLTRAWALRI